MIALDIKVKGNLGGIAQDVEKFQERLANQIVVEARRIIDESTPRGRLYRKGSLTARRTQRGIKAGFAPRGSSRMAVGSRIHRASAKGQPPAKDTGRLYRDIRVRKTGRGTYKVIFGAGYAGYLEFSLDRPLAVPAIEAAIRKLL